MYIYISMLMPRPLAAEETYKRLADFGRQLSAEPIFYFRVAIVAALSREAFQF